MLMYDGNKCHACGTPNPVGKVTVLTGAWLAMVKHAGSVQALADALQVHRITITRWGTGKKIPSALARAAVTAWCRHRRLVSPW